MADFYKAKEKTLKLEGGYSNNPNDKGGETYLGISRKWNPAWIGWKIIDSLKAEKDFPANISHQQCLHSMAELSYKQNYWDCLHLDDVNSQAIAEEIFDTSVNMGPGAAAEIVCKTLNLLNKKQKLYPDLSIARLLDTKIVMLINSITDTDVLLKTLNVFQGNKYIEICQKDESQEEFFRGWIRNRVAL
jgi:lysozyme family protein